MLFYMPSLRCAVVMGLGLLYSLANAETLDDTCRQYADENTIITLKGSKTGIARVPAPKRT